jgi:hypothetical protein
MLCPKLVSKDLIQEVLPFRRHAQEHRQCVPILVIRSSSKGVGMTAQPHDFVPGAAPDLVKSLRAIRAALVVPQDREAFDAGLKTVLDEVRVSLDLAVLNDFVHRWWISACDSAQDPEGRRHMHVRADQVLAGEPTPEARPWREVLAERESGR